MRKLLIAFVLPVSLLATAYTASVSGNWNNSATWGGAGIPGAGDTVAINNAIVVHVPSGYHAFIGTQPANDTSTPAIACASTSGTGQLVVDLGGILTVEGTVQQANSTWYVEPGATVTQDPGANTAGYSWQVGTIADQNAKLKIGIYFATGLPDPAHRATFSVANTTVPSMGFGQGIVRDSGYVEAHYADFSYWGDTTHALYAPTLNSNQVDIPFDHDTFDHCGRFVLKPVAASNVAFNNNTITNAVNAAASASLLTFTSAPNTGKTRVIHNNYWSGGLTFNNLLTARTPTGTASSGSTTLTVSSATGIAATNYVQGNGIAPFTRVTNVAGTTITLDTPTTAAISGGTVTFSGDSGLDVQDNIFIVDQPNITVATVTASGGYAYVTKWQNNIIVDGTKGSVDNGAGNGVPGGYSSDTIVTLSSGIQVGGGPYGLNFSPNVNVAIDGFIFEDAVPNSGGGDMIVPNGAASGPVFLTVRNTILEPALDSGFQPAWWTTVGTLPNFTFQDERNVFMQSSAGGSFCYGHGWEAGTMHAGEFQYIRDNLAWAPSSLACGIVRPDTGMSVGNYPPPDGTFVATDYNGWSNFSLGPYDTANTGGFGFSATTFSTPSPPGTNDVNAAPRFLDTTRTTFTWPTAGLGYSSSNLPVGTWGGTWAAHGSSVSAGEVVSNTNAGMYGGVTIYYTARIAHTKAAPLAEPGSNHFISQVWSVSHTYSQYDVVLDASAVPYYCNNAGGCLGGSSTLSANALWTLDPTGGLGWRYYWEPYSTTLFRTWLPAGTLLGGTDPVQACLQWIRQGWTSTNLSFKRKAHDQTDIGRTITRWNTPDGAR